MVLLRHLPLLAAVALTLILLLLSSALGSRVPRLRSPREEHRVARQAMNRRRHLVGPGSFPPTCLWRCGTCHPCRPIHVAIQPGLFSPMDYYPEAWRCTCGHKLFMP